MRLLRGMSNFSITSYMHDDLRISRGESQRSEEASIRDSSVGILSTTANRGSLQSITRSSLRSLEPSTGERERGSRQSVARFSVQSLESECQADFASKAYESLRKPAMFPSGQHIADDQDNLSPSVGSFGNYYRITPSGPPSTSHLDSIDEATRLVSFEDTTRQISSDEEPDLVRTISKSTRRVDPRISTNYKLSHTSSFLDDPVHDKDLIVFATQHTKTLRRFDVKAEMQSANCSHLIVNTLSGLAFVARAMFFALSLRGGEVHSEIAKAFCIACAYFLVGVGSPVLASHVSRSAAVRRIVTVRGVYLEWRSNEVKAFLFMARYFWPLAAICGVVAPVLSCIQLATQKAGSDGSFIGVTLSVPIFVCLYLWFVGTLVFETGKIDEVGLEASMACIQGVVNDMLCSVRQLVDEEQGTGRRDQWDVIAVRLAKLHEILGQLWGITCVGGLWIARISMLFIASLAMSTVALGHPSARMRIVYRIVGILFSAGGLALCLRLAEITRMCNDPRKHSNSILGVATSFLGQPLTLTESTCFHNVLTWLNGQHMGIRFFGAVVNYAAVVSLAYKMLVYMPVALVVLSHLMYPEVYASK